MILFTSDTKKFTRISMGYMLIGLFFAIFGAVYEVFSHGVYSYHMIYAFAFPLFGGALPALIFSLSQSPKKPGPAVRGIYHCGIATFTVGSVIRGVLDIYGTTNSMTQWYWLAGNALITVAVVAYFVQLILALIKKTPPRDNIGAE